MSIRHIFQFRKYLWNMILCKSLPLLILSHQLIDEDKWESFQSIKHNILH